MGNWLYYKAQCGFPEGSLLHPSFQKECALQLKGTFFLEGGREQLIEDTSVPLKYVIWCRSSDVTLPEVCVQPVPGYWEYRDRSFMREVGFLRWAALAPGTPHQAALHLKVDPTTLPSLPASSGSVGVEWSQPSFPSFPSSNSLKNSLQAQPCCGICLSEDTTHEG